MKELFPVLFVALFVTGCNSKKVPDVSKVNVVVQLNRFENDFFAMDTINVGVSLEKLHQKYPSFLQDFIFNILALPPQPDSTPAVEAGVRSFINSYRDLKDTADKVFANMGEIEKEIVGGLRYVKHYFPAYKLPSEIVTFIGPVNSYGNIITPEALGIGLQLYLGKNFSLYQSEAGQSLYPAFVSRRFDRAYIPVNCMKTIIDDMYPNASAGKPLVEQMIEAGKRLYLLDHLLPSTADTLKTGYTQNQLKGSYENEATIWGFFLQNDLLFNSDPAITKDFMNDGPKTPVLGEASPGFIGQFVGWQIVKKWIDKNEKVSPDELMKTPAKKIFDEAKYKPK